MEKELIMQRKNDEPYEDILVVFQHKPATAAEVKQYCKNKLPNTPAFYVTEKTAKMVK